MATVLVVEDNDALRLLIRARLSDKFKVLEANSGLQALSVISKEKVDILIVDIMMEGMDGFELVKQLREEGNTSPVIILTAVTSINYKKRGFELGIDDYMTKPVDCNELLWRIDAVLRRSNINSENELSIGSLTLSKVKMNAEWNGGKTDLTEKEFGLLYKLLSNPQIVFTKQQIMDDVWGFNSEADYNTIKTYINRIRNKFESCKDFEIVSVRGLGYKTIIFTDNESRGDKNE